MKHLIAFSGGKDSLAMLLHIYFRFSMFTTNINLNNYG